MAFLPRTGLIAHRLGLKRNSYRSHVKAYMLNKENNKIKSHKLIFGVCVDKCLRAG